MNKKINGDNGGRRNLTDRRSYVHLGPVLEKRWCKDRRDGIDRRKNQDPIVRIIGNERRKSLRNLSLFQSKVQGKSIKLYYLIKKQHLFNSLRLIFFRALIFH